MPPIRKISSTVVSPIGFGAMALSGFYGSVGTDEDRLAVLDAAFAAGSRHWDTADIYADSEELMGKWFARTGRRDEIFLATKFGCNMEGGVSGSPVYMHKEFEQSLERLGVDYIDLYYIHRTPTDVSIEVTIRAMAELVEQGRVKYLGISECTANDLRRAHAVHPISAYQVEYSPLYLGIEKDGTLDVCRELGITVVAYSPLARGLITGQYKSPDDFEDSDYRRIIPIASYSKENFPTVLGLVKVLEDIAAKYEATAAQVTLAWILAQGDNFVVIPGTKKVKYLHENTGGLRVQLTTEDVTAIREHANKVHLYGTRYPASAMTFGIESPALEV
ncbi:Aldo keto reductase [Cylindrobasidium torrendii FP15055 ss-10]|uniref:Aldo keto reductase n=1 Tax=Cylindrobasidium torrendii FP15055 ss-10 TaxID=1314674 RepID=A0A0D7AWG7_9AGAR|nr:Aldo keto reductase [Cylindrobasidium torrendii FP15055 ss-10]